MLPPFVRSALLRFAECADNHCREAREEVTFESGSDSEEEEDEEEKEDDGGDGTGDRSTGRSAKESAPAAPAAADAKCALAVSTLPESGAGCNPPGTAADGKDAGATSRPSKCCCLFRR
mmetsp:Transcript_114306/g.323771  ORF Transcript_114306/g.323771 Transcript_114306/m.323771 type:complete len:119 (+) Transcript_114306:327-683(+)